MMVRPQPAKTKAEVLAEMDAYAEEAKTEFEDIKANTDNATFEATHGLITEWWEHWFRTAGHKRLAYILMSKQMKDE